jgi:hypothetical protein
MHRRKIVTSTEPQDLCEAVYLPGGKQSKELLEGRNRSGSGFMGVILCFKGTLQSIYEQLSQFPIQLLFFLCEKPRKHFPKL